MKRERAERAIAILSFIHTESGRAKMKLQPSSFIAGEQRRADGPS